MVQPAEPDQVPICRLPRQSNTKARLETYAAIVKGFSILTIGLLLTAA
jgi:hypothetical protein